MVLQQSARLVVSLAVTALVTTACSSGGGGGGGGIGDSDSLPWGTKDGHLDRVNLPPREELEDQFDGRGDFAADQTIAILSTDLGEEHTEYRTEDGNGSRISGNSRRLYEGADNVSGRAVNPGNAVASLAAGREFGVARDATILGVGVVQPEGYQDRPGGGFDLTIKPEDMLSGIDHARGNGADVLAIHSVVTDPDTTQAQELGAKISEAQDDGIIAVVPVPVEGELRDDNGNSIGVDATTEFDSATMDRLLVVGGIKSDDSRPDGAGLPHSDSRDRFIVAPGDPVFAAFGNDSADAQYAGPFTAMGLVSGGAALLNSYYEDVTGSSPTPKDVADRLLATADKSFSGYDPDQHGQGVLDMREALTAQGALTLPGMSSTSVRNTQMELSSAFGDALTGQDALADVLTFDSTDWPFRVDLRSRVRQQESRYLDRHMDRLANMGPQYAESTPYGGYQITSGQPAGFAHGSYQRGYESMSLWVDQGPWTMTLQSHADPYLATAYQSMPQLDGLRLMGGGPGRAHMASWREASGASLAWSLGDALTVGSQVWTGRDGESRYQSLEDAPRVHRAEVMASVRPYSGVTLGVDVARQYQPEGLFGSSGSAGLQPGGGADTTAAGVTLQWQALAPLTLFSRYEHGWTEVDGTGGLVSDFDRLQTQSTSIGGVWEDASAKRWGLVYSQPLRVRSGDVQLSVPHALDGSDGVQFQRYSVDASPSGREQNFEVFLDMPLEARQSAVRLNLLYQLEPGHVADAAPAWGAAAGYQTRF